MGKIFKILFAIFWIIFVGIATTILYFVMGLALCITILGIPLGIVYFKAIPLIFNPVGKAVVNHYGSHPVLNTLFLIFGGLISYILTTLLCLILYITIIGIPLASQLNKIKKYFIAPFGAEIVKYGEYSKNRNTRYDFLLVADRIRRSDYAEIEIDGQVIEPVTYLKQNYKSNISKYKDKRIILVVATIVLSCSFFGTLAIFIYYPIRNILEGALLGPIITELTYIYPPTSKKKKFSNTMSAFRKKLIY